MKWSELKEKWTDAKDVYWLFNNIMEHYQPIAIGLASVLVANWIIRRAQVYMKLKRTDEKCRQQREACAEQIERLWQDVQHLEEATVQEITNLSTQDLLNRLQRDTLSAVDVLRAFQFQAVKAHRKTNCLTEPIDDALERACALDSLRGKKGPLHGLPVSVKESYFCKGKVSTGGMAVYLDHVREENAVVIDTLIEMGAVPFVRTNVPQTMMGFECGNNIYGVTCSPHDSSRGPGGSSGGEGALLALCGSVVGLGTDIGGSIRIPAALCGVAGLKTTYPRLSAKGMIGTLGGQNLVKGSKGPLARDVGGLVAVCRALMSQAQFARDPRLPPLPFDEEELRSTKPLTVGYFADTPLMPALPCYRRAVHAAAHALATAGHKVVRWDPPDALRCTYHYAHVITADKGTWMSNYLREERVHQCVRLNYFSIAVLPHWLRRVAKFFAGFVDKPAAPVLDHLHKIQSVADFFDEVRNVEEYRREFDAGMRAAGLDAVLCPGFGVPAFRHNTSFMLNAALIYTVMFNVLEVPAGTLPVTRVTSDDVSAMRDYPRDSRTAKQFHKVMEGAEGLPLNVQIVAPPFKDERCLRLMRDIEQRVDKTC